MEAIAFMPMFPAYKSRVWWLCLVVATMLAVVFSFVAVSASGWGGYISEKLMSRSGVVDSNLLIGRSGISNSELDVGMSGIVSVASATNIYMDGVGTHATLNGNLSTMNGFPSMTVYFEWGYDTSYGHTSSTETATATGTFDITIDHFNPSQTVYYRAVAEADGRNYSSGGSFVAGGAIVTGFNLLNAVVVLTYIAMVIFAMMAIASKSTIGALVFMAVAAYVGEAFVVAIQEALNALF